MSEEWFDLITEEGRVIGRARRSECHGNPALIHQAVHVLVFDRQGRLFLQQRSMRKDIQPGKWDTSVGGHLLPGEAPEAGARREMKEELGVEPGNLSFVYQYIWRSPRETELIRAFLTIHESPFSLDPMEIDAGRFWSMNEIGQALGQGLFSPQFEHEFPRMRALPGPSAGFSLPDPG